MNNKYFLLRHGEAENNVRNVCSSWPETFENHLTEKGREQIKAAAEKLDGKTVDFIFCSPLLRTQETAGIMAETVGIQPIIDERLREIGFGIFNGKPAVEFRNYFKEHGGRLRRKVPDGESYSQVQQRVVAFFKKINETYKGKTIVIVSHQAPLLLLWGWIKKQSLADSIEPLGNVFREKKITKGELVEIT